MRSRIFISYCAEDRETAYEVCRSLEMKDQLCWIAPRDVGAGMIYAERIVKAIKDCSALVLICSSASNRSSHVRNEVERAFSHDKPIVAFRIEETEPGEAFEYFLGSSQWLDAWGGEIEKKVEDLAEALGGIAGVPERGEREKPVTSRKQKERSEPRIQTKEQDVDELFQEIAGAFRAGDWGVVQKLSREILKLDSQNRAAERYLNLAVSELQSDSDEEPQREKSLPTSFADGRYAVKEFLGEGARKRVYLAHDTVLDRDVAFALIKTEGLDEDAKRRVVREAQVMGRLGAHTHIVTVHDMGKHSGQQYVVMELMAGGDLADAILATPANRIELSKSLEISKAICRGLDYAHTKGIIHRDLKPSNIWLTSEGTVKVGDFGLALRIDRSRITNENVIVGTVTYLSPEQATGAEVTARSDLYSLGVVLYEMVTGRPPFLGDDDVAIIGQHINTAPVAPSWHNGECPKPLEALIMRLLAKSPEERPASAAEVLAALDAIDLAAEEGAAPHEQSLDSMAGGVFVGRRKEMGRLKAAVEEALSGHGRMVMLMGEPGIGKTRTAEELRTYAGIRSAQVLWGKCYEGRGLLPTGHGYRRSALM
jgi:ABC-type lipoprotein export system ATPase subunit